MTKNLAKLPPFQINIRGLYSALQGLHAIFISLPTVTFSSPPSPSSPLLWPNLTSYCFLKTRPIPVPRQDLTLTPSHLTNFFTTSVHSFCKLHILNDAYSESPIQNYDQVSFVPQPQYTALLKIWIEFLKNMNRS